jgi:hypothetical protein
VEQWILQFVPKATRQRWDQLPAGRRVFITEENAETETDRKSWRRGRLIITNRID